MYFVTALPYREDWDYFGRLFTIFFQSTLFQINHLSNVILCKPFWHMKITLKFELFQSDLFLTKKMISFHSMFETASVRALWHISYPDLTHTYTEFIPNVKLS